MNDSRDLLANQRERCVHARFVNPAQNVRGAQGDLPVGVLQQPDQGTQRGLPRIAGMAAADGDAKRVIPFAEDISEVFESPGCG
jgi:hypothetical protein